MLLCARGPSTQAKVRERKLSHFHSSHPWDTTAWQGGGMCAVGGHPARKPPTSWALAAFGRRPVGSGYKGVSGERRRHSCYLQQQERPVGAETDTLSLRRASAVVSGQGRASAVASSRGSDCDGSRNEKHKS